VVNSDGNTPEKAKLCEKFDVTYIVLNREPHLGLPRRSTTKLRTMNQMPFRIDLAGGWLDQPYVSQHYPGSVITISIEPTYPFNERSGMASSTRRAAIDMWGSRIPAGESEKLAKILFCYDNPPGTEVISGSQDSIGIVFPGLANAFYTGDYWPKSIEHITEEPYLQFVENCLYLVTLGPRHSEFDVLKDTNINQNGARALAEATDEAWYAIKTQNLEQFGVAVRAAFEAQIRMFPNMLTETIQELIGAYQDLAFGWKLSGAGGGGYLILVSDHPIKDAMRIVARRASD
jgi:galactokinase/mevalonate kinase-like predicted kinase